jgi:hypothetical protein
VRLAAEMPVFSKGEIDDPVPGKCCSFGDRAWAQRV